MYLTPYEIVQLRYTLVKSALNSEEETLVCRNKKNKLEIGDEFQDITQT